MNQDNEKAQGVDGSRDDQDPPDLRYGNLRYCEDLDMYRDAHSAGIIVDILALGEWIRVGVFGELETAAANAAKAVGVPWVEPMRFSQTYEIITDESAADGDVAERGHDWETSPHTFGELVRLLQGDYCAAEPSQSHGVPRWVTAYGERDLHGGSFRNISLHPANDRARRWWPKALAAAGFHLR